MTLTSKFAPGFVSEGSTNLSREFAYACLRNRLSGATWTSLFVRLKHGVFRSRGEIARHLVADDSREQRQSMSRPGTYSPNGTR